jgi:CRISPR-associated protein Csb1
VKNDRVDPGKGEAGGAKEGYGNVPFARDEYVAKRIVAYFNLDLVQLRGFGLPAQAERLVLALSLYKIAALLEGGLRLRTACDLERAKVPTITRPIGFELPSKEAFVAELRGLIRDLGASHLFASPPITEVMWEPKAKKPKASPSEGAGTSET